MKDNKKLTENENEVNGVRELTDTELVQVVGGAGSPGDIEGSESPIPSEDNHSIYW